MSERPPETAKFRGAQSIVKAITLLNAFKLQDEFSLEELTSILRWNKSTLHRMLKVLVTFRFLAKDPTTGRYRLGIAIFELGQRAADQIELRREARPIMEELVQATQETVHLAALDHGTVLCIDKCDSPQPIRLISKVGARGSAHATGTGKALLAFFDDDSLEAFLREHELPRQTAQTITDPAKLRDNLMAARKRGYSFDDGESQQDVRCVGAPIWDYTGKVVAAMSVTGPTSRMPLQRIPTLGAQVTEAARRLSQNLGWTDTGLSGWQTTGSGVT